MIRRELLRGLARIQATTTILQRARLADPMWGMWEAADVQWWWRRPRGTDELALPVWFDDAGPVAAAGVTSFGDGWQLDVFASPEVVALAEVWTETLAVCAQNQMDDLSMLVHEGEGPLTALALQSGFVLSEESPGTAWMEPERRPPVERVPGFELLDRLSGAGTPHPMIARNGERIEARLRQGSLYDPELDLAVAGHDGRVAGYALFWFDPVTLVGLLEPMRVEEEFQRRGLGRMLLTHGLDRLVRRGARRLKVGFSSDPGRSLYLGAGFVQTSVDRVVVRPGRRG